MAVVVVAASFLLRYFLVQGLGLAMPPFITFFPAIIIVAVLAGLGPGLLATALAALAADYFILPPFGFGIASISDAIALVLFVAMGILTSLLAEGYRRGLLSIAAYKVEQALWMQQEKLDVVLASMTDAVFISDASGQFLQFNDAFATFHRFRNKSECAKTLAEYPEFLEVSMADGQLAPLEMWAVPRALRGETASNEEYRLRRKDTGETWIGSYSFGPVRDHEGAIIGSVVVGRDITEQKRAEEALRKSETLYHGLFDSMDEGFCIIEMIFDAEGKPADYRFLEINAAFERQTGLHEAAGKRMRELAPAHEEYWFEIYGKIALTGEPAHFLNEAKALNCYYEVSAYRVGEPELRQVAIVFSDTSERRRAEAHIRQLNRVYAVLSDINQTIVREKDSQAMLEAACRIATEKGKFQMAWIGMVDPVTKLLEPIASSGAVEGFLDLGKIIVPDLDHDSRPMARCFASGGYVICNDIEQEIAFRPLREEALRRGYLSGGSFPLKVDGQTVGVFNLYANEKGFFEGDDVSLLDEMVMDISHALEVNLHEKARQEAEIELRWRTAFFEAQVDSAQDGILVVDSKGKKILQNRRMNELLKIPQHVSENQDNPPQLEYVATLVKNPGQFADKVNYLTFHPEKIDREEIELLDGTILEEYSSPVRDKERNYYGRIWTLRDITERRQLEEQFRQSQKMEAVGQLTGGIAHDFNNLLTVIIGCSEFIGEEAKENPRLSKMAKMILDAAQRGADLTHRMLAFARRQALQPKPIEVNRMLANMESFLRRTLSADIDLEVIQSGEDCTALVDLTQLESALLNLCVNARDAMPAGGKLIVETGIATLDSSYAEQNADVTPGQYILIAVSDTGCGISRENLSVFDPFFTTKEVGKGTGLGLSMVYGFAKQSHGHVKIYSELGQGTSVKLYLPQADPECEPSNQEATLIADLQGSEIILLVEDNAPVREFAKTQLLHLGYQVLEAANGKDALEILKGHQDIDLLFTDVVMPGGLNGRELALEARKLYPALKVLFCSGYAESAILHMGLMDKDVQLLNKPYSRLQLARRIREMLTASQSAPEEEGRNA
jgi:signal transduction histidine kinase/CheY-like chemotaxis protein/two-component sensor histidine kinase